MTGEHVGVRSPSLKRTASREPPGFDRVADAFSRSGRWHLAIGAMTLLGAAGLFAAGLLGVAGGAAGTAIFFSAGALLLLLALLPLLQGWRRLKRVGFLSSLRNRWTQLARAGDPDDQIGTLQRAYAGLIGNDLRTRMAASP